PAEDGTVLASTAVHPPPPALVPNAILRKDPRHALRIPAQSGPFYLTITPEGNDLAALARNQPLDGPEKITLHLLGNDRPLLTLADPGATIPIDFSHPEGKLPSDRRVLFTPAAHLIGLIPAAGDKLVLLKFDPAQEVRKAGADYIYVDSKPPIIEPGKPFRYELRVTSKAGGVKAQLALSPPGTRMDGTTFIWDAPVHNVNARQSATIRLTDASGLSVNHTLPFRFKD